MRKPEIISRFIFCLLALGEEELLVNLLDLGVKPVGANVNLPEKVALTKPGELAGIELFPSAGNISIETLAALKPDLIIGTSFFVEAAGYDKLSAIAPTVVIASGGCHRCCSWRCCSCLR